VRRSVVVGIASAAYSNVWGDGSGSTTLVGGGALLSVGTTVTPYTVYRQDRTRRPGASWIPSSSL
jgi:hypothetical protein